jgi:hypothetical protein
LVVVDADVGFGFEMFVRCYGRRPQMAAMVTMWRCLWESLGFSSASRQLFFVFCSAASSTWMSRQVDDTRDDTCSEDVTWQRYSCSVWPVHHFGAASMIDERNGDGGAKDR